MNTTTTDMTVANEILRQLGGNRFLVMTGSKNLLGGENFLQLRIGSGCKDGINSMRVTLDASDTYTVVFHKVGRAPKFEVKKVAEFSDIYADGLQELFTRVTGFHTHF